MIHWEFCLDFEFIHFAIFLLLLLFDWVALEARLNLWNEHNKKTATNKFQTNKWTKKEKWNILFWMLSMQEESRWTVEIMQDLYKRIDSSVGYP